jgi:hypothetical protein
MSRKDALTLLISAAALLLSAGTAYFTLIRQTEKLALVVQSLPLRRTFTEQSVDLTTGDGTLVFTNLGTRPITVVSAEMFFEPANDCRGWESWNFDVTFRPLIVKPAESLTRTIRPTRSRGSASELTEGAKIFELPFNLAEQKFYNACLRLEMTTPSRARILQIVTLVELSVGPGNRVSWGGGQSKGAKDDNYPPHILIDKTTTIFQ